MRDVIPMIELLRELQDAMPSKPSTPKLHCRGFEDNRGCIDLAKMSRVRPRTKHIALKYHHFREHVRAKTISVTHIDTKNQVADIFTKALPGRQFDILRIILTGHTIQTTFKKVTVDDKSGNSTVREGVLA